MIGLLQRVSEASVKVDNAVVGEIGSGLLVFIGVEKNDTEAQADRLLERLLNYRVFADSQDKMNLSLRDLQSDLLLVSQFTLPADTRKGNRPSFTPAAAPAEGKRLFNYLVNRAQTIHHNVATGEFGADMKVSLVNDGPVTFWLQVSAPKVEL